jgi:hypothetical protein
MDESLKGNKKEATKAEHEERLLEMERLRNAMLDKRAKRVRTVQDRHC